MLASIKDLFPDFDSWPTVPDSAPTFNGHPHNWEREALFRLVIWKKAVKIFEIGTYTGETANALTNIAGVARVWTLNIPGGALPTLPITSQDRQWIISSARDPSLHPNAIQLWGDSATFDFSPYMQACDLVWVMGAHSPEYIANDLRAAFGLINNGGLVVLHAGNAEGMAGVGPEYDVFCVGDRMGVVLRCI